MKYVLILLAALFLVSCGAPRYLATPSGETATLSFRSSSRPDAEIELLAVNDSLVYVTYVGRYERIPVRDVGKIKVRGFTVPVEQKIPGILAGLLWEGVILGAAGSAHEQGWQAASIAAMVGTIALYATGGPKTSFQPPFDKTDLEKLRLFCRYPQGLTSDQWQIVLQAAGQDDFYEHGKLSRPVAGR